MTNNTRTNTLIKWGFVVGDFIVLNILLGLVLYTDFSLVHGGDVAKRVFILVCNVAMALSETQFSTVVHMRWVGADHIIRRTTMLILTQTLLSYVILRALQYGSRIGNVLLVMGVILLISFYLLRIAERLILKRLRFFGRNTRTVTMVGSHIQLRKLYERLTSDLTMGYKMQAYYGRLENLPQAGDVDDFVRLLDTPDQLQLGDELYLCVSRSEMALIKRTAQLCDNRLVKFYYLPWPEETLKLQPVILDNCELYTTYVSPLEDGTNQVIKRIFDIILSSMFLLVAGLLFPIVALIIKIQSPGPVFFKQLRTGLDGRNFYCYKFRSMHVNADADKVQATKDDPRKYPFGNFMRKANIDELPQFWNVLRGDMSIVGPRPHMLAHTEQYSQLIDKYMVRHFVKPGVTGWAQVTGFRGETQELWQMEGRVERDIWYIQHWSVWLDIRIIWMTVKTIFVHDTHAY